MDFHSDESAAIISRLRDAFPARTLVFMLPYKESVYGPILEELKNLNVPFSQAPVVPYRITVKSEIAVEQSLFFDSGLFYRQDFTVRVREGPEKVTVETNPSLGVPWNSQPFSSMFAGFDGKTMPESFKELLRLLDRTQNEVSFVYERISTGKFPKE